MQRKAHQHDAAHPGKRSGGLRLRRHAPAERLAAREQRQAGPFARRVRHCGPHGGLRHGGRIRPLAAFLEVGEQEAQRRDAALRQAGRAGRHERMVHAGAGAVREHVAGLGVRRRIEQGGDAAAVGQRDGGGSGR
jgi:hypothetical protein